MLDDAEVSFNHVTTRVVLGVEGRRPPAMRSAPFAVSDLVGGLRDHRADAATTQLRACRTTRIGLIAPDTVGAGPRSAPHFEVGEQMLELGAVMGLSGRDQDYQWAPGAVDEVVDFAGPSAARAANAVVRRLDAQILVIRPSPLCGG